MAGGHGDHDAQGHGGHDAGHGPAEIPPAPPTRSISPAREEYEQPWPGNLLLWPVVWLGVAFVLFAAAQRWSHDWRHDAHAAPGDPVEHAAPAEHGTPAGHGR